MSENAKWLGYIITVAAAIIIFCFLVFLASERERDTCRSVSSTQSEYTACMHPGGTTPR